MHLKFGETPQFFLPVKTVCRFECPLNSVSQTQEKLGEGSAPIMFPWIPPPALSLTTIQFVFPLPSFLSFSSLSHTHTHTEHTLLDSFKQQSAPSPRGVWVWWVTRDAHPDLSQCMWETHGHKHTHARMNACTQAQTHHTHSYAHTHTHISSDHRKQNFPPSTKTKGWLHRKASSYTHGKARTLVLCTWNCKSNWLCWSPIFTSMLRRCGGILH